jgi:hypothetical protein
MPPRKYFTKTCLECGKVFHQRWSGSVVCSRSCAAKRTWKLATPKHGLANKIPEYYVWKSMRQRCNNPNAVGYERWGGRGIRVCSRWNSFKKFYQDMGPRPSSNHQIERKNNSGNYTPLNCCWATKTQQGRNKRNNRLLSYDGETLPVSAWAERMHVNPDRLYGRLNRGWSIQQTLSIPFPNK